MADWSRHDGKLCVECQHSATWKPYGGTFRVCHAPGALAVHGGPRACAEIVRSPTGACKPEAKWFQKRQ